MSDLQRFDSFRHFHGPGCTQRSPCCKVSSSFVKDQLVDFRLGDRGRVWPMRVLQGIRVHYTEGFCSKFFSQEMGKPRCLGLPSEENALRRCFIPHTDGAIPVNPDHAGDDKWTIHSSSQESGLSSCCESGIICDAEPSTTKIDNSLQASAVARAGGTVNNAGNFGQLNQMSNSSCYGIPPKPSAPLGWLSLGLCGKALITRVGSDARFFHHQGLPDFGEHTSCGDTFHAPAGVKAFGRPCSGLGGTVTKVEGQEAVSQHITTKNRVENFAEKQNKQRKVGKTTILTRNLYERSSFHLLEVLFCYPFLYPNAVASSFQIPSQKSLREVVSILNQATVGLAGVSATWLLFVASRILWIDVSLDKHNITSLAMGFGFLSLSWALKRVSDVFMCLANVYSRSKVSQQEYITSLQKELQCIALNAILLIVMCFMGGG